MKNVEELGPPDLEAAGLQLWVHGRQFPDASDYYDGNWLRVTAHAGGAGADVWTTGSILMTTDLAQWADRCDALDNGKAQDAELSPMEPELKVRISKKDSLGHFTMRVEITPDNPTQQHQFEFEIDQTFLPRIAGQCRAIVKKYPIRGEAPSGGRKA